MAKDVKESVKEPEVQANAPEASPDLTALTQKLDTVINALPPNFCEEFPNLCKLGPKVDSLAETVESLKKVTPAKITVKVPKQEAVKAEAPTVDASEIAKSVSDSLKELPDKTSDVLGPKLDTLIEAVSKTVAGPSEQKAEKSEEVKPEEPKPEETSSTKPREESPEPVEHKHVEAKQPVHTTADEYFDCPECNANLLAALKAKIQTKDDLDDTTKEFLANVKTLLSKKGEGSEQDKRGEDPEKVRIQADSPTGRSDNTIREDAGNKVGKENVGDVGEGTERDVEPERTDTKQAAPTDTDTPAASTEPDTECKSGFCLLRGVRGNDSSPNA